jgi:fructose-1,6-bisphosphatase/inositol monophosphatase family enzyme
MIRFDMDRVSELVRQVGQEEVLPRFRTLTAADIIAKPSDEDPEDLVTAVDRAAEERLALGLEELVPGVLVVGEEAAAQEPSLLVRAGTEDRVLYVDPLDGTKNFAEGYAGFGVMVALVERFQPIAAWIYLPLEDEMLSAELGAGAFLNGERLHAEPSSDEGWVGTLYVRHFPEHLRGSIPIWHEHLSRHIPPLGSAAVEYSEIARGRKDFTAFYKLMPWDHAPGALIVEEAGGTVRHLDGRPYGTSDENAVIVALSQRGSWERVLSEVFGLGGPESAPLSGRHS